MTHENPDPTIIPDWAVPGAKIICVKPPRVGANAAGDRIDVAPIAQIKKYEVCTIASTGIEHGRAVCVVRERPARYSYAIDMFRPRILRGRGQDMAVFLPLLDLTDADMAALIGPSA